MRSTSLYHYSAVTACGSSVFQYNTIRISPQYCLCIPVPGAGRPCHSEALLQYIRGGRNGLSGTLVLSERDILQHSFAERQTACLLFLREAPESHLLHFIEARHDLSGQIAAKGSRPRGVRKTQRLRLSPSRTRRSTMPCCSIRFSRTVTEPGSSWQALAISFCARPSWLLRKASTLGCPVLRPLPSRPLSS